MVPIVAQMATTVRVPVHTLTKEPTPVAIALGEPIATAHPVVGELVPTAARAAETILVVLVIPAAVVVTLVAAQVAEAAVVPEVHVPHLAAEAVVAVAVAEAAVVEIKYSL